MIFFCGAPHGTFTPIIRVVETYSPQAVILLGDFDLERPIEQEVSAILDRTEVWFILGNHDSDCDRWYDNLFNSGLPDCNWHGCIEVPSCHRYSSKNSMN